MIFADSSYFIAVADKKDQWHEKAMVLSKKAKEELLITDFVLAETVTVIGARGGEKAGKTIYNYLIDNCQITFTSKDMLEESMKVFLKFDGTLSVADAVTVAVMQEIGVKRLLSFDSDFDRVGGIERLA